MKLINLFIFIFISAVWQISAQSFNEINDLQKHYESFEYSTVISKADNLLLDKERFSDESLIQIYMLKAASHFAMSDNEDSRKSFIDLLKINENFELDSTQYSPKLIDFFKNVKAEFWDILNVNYDSEISKPEDESKIPIQIIKSDFHTAIAKSLILPGWGHLHLKNNTQGWILTSVGTITLSSMIYFIFDANAKENNYLSETNLDLIQRKYVEYNNSYKIRNTLIITYAAVWLYSQVDLLFFSNEIKSENISVSFSNTYQKFDNSKILISFQIPF
jgi:hypothetical protein